jgi:DNA modification methylase
LQLDVIERCIDLWSNPNDTVLTPFLGIGSEVFCAVQMGRKGIGIELKPSYFAQAKRNLESAEDCLGGLFGEAA